MTSSDKSARSFLAARDNRQDVLSQILGTGYPATIFLSLNIPGCEKTLPGAKELYDETLGKLSLAFPGSFLLCKACDSLGYYAIIGLDTSPVEAKKICIALETQHPFSRLIDLDVYSGQGRQIGRDSLGFSARQCLICTQPAVECIRVKRHSIDEIIAQTHALLTRFRA